MSDWVYVEFKDDGVFRIFRTTKDALLSKAYEEGRVLELQRKDAVEKLRWSVFHRDQNRCVLCGKILTWKTMEMDERTPKSQLGEQSMDNCQSLCHRCHVEKHGRVVGGQNGN